MGREVVYCFRCQSRVTGADIEKGAAVRLTNHICCAKCLTPDERQALEKTPREGTALRGGIRPPTTRKTMPSGQSTARLDAIPDGPPHRRRLVLVIGGAAGGVLLLGGVILLLLLRGGKKEPPGPPDVAAPVAPPNAAGPKKAEDPPRAPDAPAPSSFRLELDALGAELSGSLSQNNLRVARSILDRARGRHAEAEWDQGIRSFERDLENRARARFKEIMERGAGAAERKAVEELRAARAEIAGWGPLSDGLVKEFDRAFGELAAAPVPPANPSTPAASTDPKAPEPAPAPPNPPWETARKYLEPW